MQIENTTLRETGIIGSIRWWYEALIRDWAAQHATRQTQIAMGIIIVMHVSYLDAQVGQGNSGWK